MSGKLPDGAHSAETQPVVLEGTGRYLGLPIEWNLSLGPNGAFIEKFVGEKFSCLWGTSGFPSCDCWEMDYSGVTRSVELDDRESCLLTTWLRSGRWLHPSVLQGLHVERVNENSTQSSASEEAVMSSVVHPTIGQDALEQQQEPEKAVSPSPMDASLRLTVCLKNGKVKITVCVDLVTWLPIKITQDLFGDQETWTLHNWRQWCGSRVLYPERIVHTATSGGLHEYKTTSARLLVHPNLSVADPTSVFQPPPFKLLPENSEFDHTAPNLIPAWKTPSCHILVKPLINDRDIGYMILDTGASGLVMEKAAADSLQLEKFGELFVSGVSGKVPAHFRRAKSLVLGPLTVNNPQFMEMPVPGLVAGVCSPVIGIIGYDVFRRAVVEMGPRSEATASSEAEPNFTVKLYDNEQFTKIPKFNSVEWFNLHMITNLPHIRARFSTNGTAVYEGLFMIDTGAGGAFVMFMSRAVSEYGLQNDLQTNFKTFVKGVGGNQTERLPVRNGQLKWFELGGKKLENITCLFFSGSKMDISVYGSGILCMNMLQDSRLVMDYARQRMTVIHSDKHSTGDHEESSSQSQHTQQ